jgi:hypothetical protein
MPKPSNTMIVQIVRVAGSRSMRAEIVPPLSAARPLTFMFSSPHVAGGIVSRSDPHKTRVYCRLSNARAAAEGGLKIAILHR